MLIWRIDGDTDVDAAAFNLEKAKEFLVREEPGTDQVLVFILNPVRRIDKAMYEARNILCMTERQLIKYANVFFSDKQECLRLGESAYRQGLYEEAMALLGGAGSKVDVDAQFMIGQMAEAWRRTRRLPRNGTGRLPTRVMPPPHLNLKKASTGRKHIGSARSRNSLTRSRSLPRNFYRKIDA